VPDYLDTQVRLKTNLTPATRWAPILQWVLVGAAGALILAAIRHNGWFPRPARRRPGPPDGDSHTPSGEADDADARSDPKDDLDAENAAASQLKTANEAPSDEGGGTRIGRDEGAT
jgi:apolipoprotein N-acyltransferase